MSHRRGTCDRCQRDNLKIETTFPDGQLCTTCYAAAVRTRGTCATCTASRLLPGLDAEGQLICVDRAGINRSYCCSRCPNEWALKRGICERCFLGDTLDELLAGPVDLSPLRDRLMAAARPDSLIIWLYDSRVRDLLRSLSDGSITTDHDGLDTFPSRRIGDHVRSLLVDVGLIPHRDEVLARYDRWVNDHLDNLSTDPDDLRLLQQFAQWHLRANLDAKAARSPLRASQMNHSTHQLRVSAEFLAWLRQRGRTLSSCRQADFDKWWSDPNSNGTAVRTFFKWAIKHNHTPPLHVGYRRGRDQPMLTQEERLDALVKTLSPSSGPLTARVAAMLVLLLAQPFHRIAALRLADISSGPRGTTLRITDQRIDVPDPFAALLCDLVANRPNANTAANPTSEWLFPGNRAGHHRCEDSLRKDVRQLGIKLLAARNAALRQLALDCPAAVIATMLDYSYGTIDRHATAAGTRWKVYASGRTSTHHH